MALHGLLKPRLPHTVLIDGDAVRQTFAQSLGYTEPDRREQIQRIQRLAKFMADQKLIVIVAALYCHPDLTDWNRSNLEGYFEIYLKASDDLLRQRDQKNLYSTANSEPTPNVVGIDIPWHAPASPHITIDSDVEHAPIDLAREVLAANKSLGEAFKHADPGAK